MSPIENLTMTDVIVAADSPLGLISAICLGREGVNVTVLETVPWTQRTLRAMWFHWSLMPALKDLGVLPEALATGVVEQVWEMDVRSTGERFRFDLGVLADVIEHPHSLHITQQELVVLLLRHIEGLPITVEWKTPVTSLEQDHVGCTVVATGPEGSREFRSQWVIGADGAQSKVRQLAGLGLPGMTWPERFIAANLDFDFSALGIETSAGWIDPTYGALITRMNHDELWRYLYAEDLNLPEQNIPDRMAEMFGEVLPPGAQPGVHDWTSLRMHQRVADRFRVGRVLLEGDAAHVTNPAVGYGLAGGIFDSVLLCEALLAVMRGQSDDKVLDYYAAERRRVFTEIASPVSSEAKQLLFNAEDPARLEVELERLRAATRDRDSMRQYFLASPRLDSPSLIDVKGGERAG